MFITNKISFQNIQAFQKQIYFILIFFIADCLFYSMWQNLLFKFTLKTTSSCSNVHQRLLSIEKLHVLEVSHEMLLVITIQRRHTQNC